MSVPEPEPKHKTGLYMLLLILGLIVCLVLCAAVIPAAVQKARDHEAMTLVAPGTTVDVEIPEGADGQSIFGALVDAGLLTNDQSSDFMHAALAQGNNAQNMQAGTYTFTGGMTPEELAQALVAGPQYNAAYTLTIPEGYTVQAIANAIEKNIPTISADDFMAQAKASNYVSDYPFLADAADNSLEGFLFPRTYNFHKDVDADTVLRAMLDQYQSEIGALDFETARQNIATTYGLDFSDYDFLKLASIIEREAASDDDRPTIASVFYNRMRDGMPLQSDATSEYYKGDAVTPDDLQQNNPYNTYLNEGLPLTPICSPGEASLQAALNPTQTDYYFFYIIKDGDDSHSWYAEDYDQHLANIAAAQEQYPDAQTQDEEQGQ